MSNLGKYLKTGAVILSLGLTAQAMAAGFKVPVHYTVQLVDGQTKNFDYSKSNRTLNLTSGRHQIVVLFESRFGTSSESRMIQAANPIVIEINDMGSNDVYTFDYPLPRSQDAAAKFAREQKIELKTIDGKALPSSLASYYILTSESGFSVLRDYRQDLMSLNRLYAPDYVKGSERTIGMTSYGAPAIEANPVGNMLTARSSNTQGSTAMPAPMVSYEQQSNLATSGSSQGAASTSAVFNQIIDLYNRADERTKRQVIQYVNTH